MVDVSKERLERDRQDTVMRLSLVRKAIDEGVDIHYVSMMMEGAYSLIVLRGIIFDEYLCDITYKQTEQTWHQIRAILLQSANKPYSPNLLTTDMLRFSASVKRLEDAILAHNE